MDGGGLEKKTKQYSEKWNYYVVNCIYNSSRKKMIRMISLPEFDELSTGFLILSLERRPKYQQELLINWNFSTKERE